MLFDMQSAVPGARSVYSIAPQLPVRRRSFSAETQAAHREADRAVSARHHGRRCGHPAQPCHACAGGSEGCAAAAALLRTCVRCRKTLSPNLYAKLD